VLRAVQRATAAARQGRRAVGSANVLFGRTRFACPPNAPLISLRRPPGILGGQRSLSSGEHGSLYSWRAPLAVSWRATADAGSGRRGALRSEIKGAFE